MIDLQWWLSVLVFAIVSSGTPGPNNVMLLASGLNYGALKTLPHGLGITIGFPVMVLAVGGGLGQLFLIYPIIHEVIKVLGVGYLLYLAWKIASTRHYEEQVVTGRPLTFVQAALFQWVNPKAWIMAISSISLFAGFSDHVMFEVLLISSSFFVANIMSTNLWVFCGVFLKRLLSNQRHYTVFNISMGVLLALTVLPIVTSTL